jgi:hypothetical protein
VTPATTRRPHLLRLRKMKTMRALRVLRVLIRRMA